MSLALFKAINPWSRLIIYFLMILVSSVIIGVVGGLVVMGIYGLSVDDLQNFGTDLSERMAGPLLWINTIVLQIGGFIIPAFLFVWFFGKKSVNGYWMYSPKWKILLVPVIMVFAMPVIELLVHLNDWMIPEGSWLEATFKPMEESAAEVTEAILIMPNWGSYLRNVLLIAIFPAIGEELAFRGVLQSQLAKITKNVHLAIWISAMVFSAIHLQFYGFFARMFLGAIMGYLLVWTGSMWAPILAHFTNNFLGVTMEFYAQKNNIVTEELNEGIVNQTSILTISVAIFVVVIVYFVKNNEWQRIREAYFYEHTEDNSLV